MTRAEEVLKILEQIITKRSPFFSQYKFNPGQRVPLHLQKRRHNQVQMNRTRTAAYPPPHTTSPNHRHDRISTPLN